MPQGVGYLITEIVKSLIHRPICACTRGVGETIDAYVGALLLCEEALFFIVALFSCAVFEIKLGTVDEAEADVEWRLKPYMNTAKKRLALSKE